MNTEQGLGIGGKHFTFVKVTISGQLKMLRAFRMSRLDKFLLRLRPERENLRAWKRVRSVAFVKDWKWKYFGIIPQELRCSQISLKQAGEIQACFFSYVSAEVKGHDEPLTSAIDSKTASEPTR